jgi:ABC-2 type transport system ATP-binding protein
MIELRGLRKSFGEVEALRGVTLDVPRGVVGLLGPNGAGKSTLIRILLGLEKASSGLARVLGADCSAHPLDIRSRVGYMPEGDCHIPGLSAVGYVAFAAELSGLPPSDAIRRAHEVLDYVGMDEERYRQVETYSSGMRQRIKLAQAVVHDPELLFLDEPTDGMDPRGRSDMLRLIRDVGSTGDVSVLVSSHLLTDVEEVCSHVVILGMGTVRLAGRLSELARAEANSFDVRLVGETSGLLNALEQTGARVRPLEGGLLRVSLAEGTSAARIVELAHVRHVQVRHLRQARNTLEEVFMRAMEEHDLLSPVPEAGEAHAHS